MSWKIVKIETLDDKSIECPSCRVHTNFTTVSERNQIMKNHSNCIAGASLSFPVTYYVYPTCSSQCSLCNTLQDPDHDDIVIINKKVICATCAETLRDIYGCSQ